ncbi:NADH-quinone oxidoreductase subunit C [Guyparkeria hydrothermalis]|uniref:NADH-quinone oxidoreductase subunit C n=1 Tax=Guyparkeria hydrothermalis TaxID=923 RepID=UPI002022430A|nr:NADH-quinone oxidoreductase subunit C [Guyparkeria hydrothermalis]MCL7743646.1 NADH-quinone oxidoreductase subunit C [Guyparkeria hydrothermalis]
MNLQTALKETIGEYIVDQTIDRGELTIEVEAKHWREVAERLEKSEATRFEQCVDICGIDYLEYGRDEWAGEETVSYTGYSRGVEPNTSGWLKFGDEPDTGDLGRPRFAAVAHLLSYTHNWRLRVRIYCPDDQAPAVPSVVSVWAGVNWFEREAFDLFGILFDGHPDLRRILTDYGFVGHPFRKDFPLIGHVEVRYDTEKGRVVYEPVSIEPRVLVPKVHRDDSRYIDLDEG